MDSLIVQKYGGTSIATTEDINNVALKIVKRKLEGHRMVVIVSAMGKSTDELEQMAREVNINPPAREMDILYATGEQKSMALLAMAIEALGHSAISLTGPQVGIITTKKHTKAIIEEVKTERILSHLAQGDIVIVAGFQGISREGEITTLGRGGSDTTAMSIACALNAEVCEIFTDVDGIYTADPRHVKNPRKLDVITTEEMLELASSGASVLHSRSVELAEKFGVPLIVAHSHLDVPGTLVKKEDSQLESVLVRGVALNENEARININNVPDKPGVAADIFCKLDKGLINVDVIVQTASTGGTTDISFTVNQDDMKKAVEIVSTLKERINFSEVTCDENVSKVSAVGVGMRTKPGVAATFFRALADEQINIQMITTSDIKMSCVVQSKDGKKAVQALHKAFDLDKA